MPKFSARIGVRQARDKKKRGSKAALARFVGKGRVRVRVSALRIPGGRTVGAPTPPPPGPPRSPGLGWPIITTSSFPLLLKSPHHSRKSRRETSAGNKGERPLAPPGSVQRARPRRRVGRVHTGTPGSPFACRCRCCRLSPSPVVARAGVCCGQRRGTSLCRRHSQDGPSPEATTAGGATEAERPRRARLA